MQVIQSEDVSCFSPRYTTLQIVKGRTGKYTAHLNYKDGERDRFGPFPTLKEAKRARDEARGIFVTGEIEPCLPVGWYERYCAKLGHAE